ncbi:Catabolite control protein A [Posidoniimonas polymericola]|uniref:Catabolite control protein A n=1 Tax=Posidoniimonas polymericola TaxID=2528002 RepID=A0A5C5XVP3_9BACT|nr:LacI family DNA-binding transcriptional regulator [Posidoniimonas polymericola]TWT66758.1 Catabolite control protein A [Posidoniimonas polymericola]
MASIREVAKHAGVSIATVSRVVNGVESVAPKLRRDVLQAVEACGYKPAEQRRSASSIALIYAGPFTIGSPYDSACVDGIVSAMRESRYDLSVIDIRRDRAANESFKQVFARKGIAGAIVRCTIEDRPLVVEMAAEQLPIVVLGDHFEHPTIAFAYTESAQASREAIEHLVSLGHQRIAFVACHREDGDHADRFRAYCDVLTEHQLLNESLVYRVPPSRRDGGPVLRKLVGSADRPTAVYIADPLIAAGAINEAHHMGVRIPDDLSIVGFDDTDLRHLVYPSMSAVCQDSEELGRSAFQLLLGLIDGEGDAESSSTRQQAWLEVHGSTGPPPVNVDRVMPSGSRLPAR